MLLFGRSVSVASDDFVAASLWSLLTRFAWAATASVWVGSLAGTFKLCDRMTSGLAFAAISLAIMGGVLDALLCVNSVRGSFARDAQRGCVPRLVEVRIVTILLDVTLAGVLAAAAAAAAVVGSGLTLTTCPGGGGGDARTALFGASIAVAVLGGVSVLSHVVTWVCAGACRSHAPALVQLHSKLSISSSTADDAQALLNQAFAPAARAWGAAMRILGSILCPSLRLHAGASYAAALAVVGEAGEGGSGALDSADLEQILLRLQQAAKAGAAKDLVGGAAVTLPLNTTFDTFAHAGIVTAAVFEPCVALAWTPSDVIASLMLLAAEQAAKGRLAVVVDTNYDTSLSPSPSFSDTTLAAAIAAAEALEPFALATYGAPLLCLERGPLLGAATLCAAAVGFAANDATHASCAPGAIDCAPGTTICHGLTIFDCDRVAARVYLWRAGPTVLVGAGHPGFAPWVGWLATLRLADGALVVSVRGTLSGENALFDLLALPLPLTAAPGGPEALSALHAAGGSSAMAMAAPLLPLTEAVHEGMWIAAAGIAASLRARGLLTPPPPRLVLVGHSLGAGVVSLLALQLLGAAPIVECVALAPPPRDCDARTCSRPRTMGYQRRLR